MKKQEIKEILADAKDRYMDLQIKQEDIYQNVLKDLGLTEDEGCYIFDYVANDYLTDEQIACRVKLWEAQKALDTANKVKEPKNK